MNDYGVRRSWFMVGEIKDYGRGDQGLWWEDIKDYGGERSRIMVCED